MIGFSFASDWLRGWREFSRPITERSKAKPMQSRITFDTRLKIALCAMIVVVVASICLASLAVFSAKFWTPAYAYATAACVWFGVSYTL